MNFYNNKFFIIFQRLMESDSEGSLKDFIDDDDETTESSDGSSSDKTDTQAAEEGKGSNQKRVGRYTRSTCNNLVEGELTVFMCCMCLITHTHIFTKYVDRPVLFPVFRICCLNLWRCS